MQAGRAREAKKEDKPKPAGEIVLLGTRPEGGKPCALVPLGSGRK